MGKSYGAGVNNEWSTRTTAQKQNVTKFKDNSGVKPDAGNNTGNNGSVAGTSKQTMTAANGMTLVNNANKASKESLATNSGYKANVSDVEDDTSSADAYWEAYLAQQKAAEEAQKKAIQDAVDQSVNTLNAQKTTTSQDYADAYRQLYLNNMQSQKNIGQQMAAQGVTGGASESTLLGLNTNYEDNLRQGKVAEQNALSELDTAIANAKLSGSIEAANNTATNAQNTAQGYLTAWQQKLAAEQTAAQQEQSQASENRQYAYQIAMAMLQSGSMPSETLLKNAGISTADAQTIVAQVAASKVASGSGSGTNNNTVDNSGIYTYLNTGAPGASANAKTSGTLDYWTVLNDVNTMINNGTDSTTIKNYIKDQYSASSINGTQANALINKVG